MSFFNSFFGITDLSKEQAVLCPFPHKTDSGETYLENRPSAHVNTTEKLFHCKACGRGFNETQFIEEVFGCDYITAKKVQMAFMTEETIEDWDLTTEISKETASRARSLGISDTVIESLKIRTPNNMTERNVIAFPVEMYGALLDIRKYNPGAQPKVRSRTGAISGLIIPFCNLQNTGDNEPIFICAGEKDCSLALTHRMNAITITGGEKAKPVCPKLFANKKVIILYDNDDAGIDGANSLAEFLYPFTNKIKVVTGFHEICKEKGEDITDFFTKYNGTVQQLMSYIRATPWFKPSNAHKETHLDIVNLYQATQPEYLNKLVKTPIQVVGVEDRAFNCPISIVAEKFKAEGSSLKNTLTIGTVKDWRLRPENAQDILHLVDENFKEAQIHEHLKVLAGIPASELYVSIKPLQHETIYRATVIDLYEQSNSEVRPMEFNALILGQRLESGKKYLVTHKMCPHPYRGQQLTMVITNIEESNDSITTFRVNDKVKEHLAVFQNKSLEEISEKMKANIGFDVNSALLRTIDLAYHTPLMFNFDERNKNIRATLDTLIISESRVGKSSTAKALQETYGLGAFVSLAGNAATIAGLVGGSSKIGNSSNYQTRAGIIPQNHKGLLILEELGKANNDLMRELTDIRSSSQVRITRVSGSIQLPAMLRMIALTNPKPRNGIIKPIAAYPNGIAIVTELVGTPEDIARYDIIHIVADKGAETIDANWTPEEPFTQEQYRTRIKWIWSREPEQIIIDEDVRRFIIERSNALNEIYGAHIKIFGTETWKKLSRLAIAIAGYTVSTDESYEKIIVKKTHVNEAINLLVSYYDNPTFRLKEFVENEKLYTETDDDAIAALQDIFTRCPALVYALNTQSETNANILAATTGLDRVELNKLLQRMVRAYFIKFDGNDIIPTTRYRRTAERIDKNVIIDRVGEALQITTPEEDEDDDF